MPMSLQTKSLRVFENRESRMLGTNKNKNIYVRIIAATNQKLEEKINKKGFRADLFYRLNVASLTIPPLREIKKDIPHLVAHFLKRSSDELGKAIQSISIGVQNYILEKEWLGNTRELENSIRR